MDKVEITVTGGKGGDGIISFRHEKFVPFGGPDGGDGGRGGDVYIVADSSTASLDYFRHRKCFKAQSGRHGGKQKKHGADGEDLIIRVPVGTLVFCKEDNGELFLADLSQPEQKVLVARGGSGGLGNAHFATAINRAPQVATSGASGEERHLILELKAISDVAMVGRPNVGKSALLRAVSRARPKIADYPFTTRQPVMGVVEKGMRKFVLTEIPAIVDGAYLGKGLGHDFLRHAERAKVLLHLLDGSSPSIVDDMKKLNVELAVYKQILAEKPQLLVVNKIDLPEVKTRLPELRQIFNSLGVKVCFVSAITGEGVPELVSELIKMLDKAPEEPIASEMPIAVFKPKPKVRQNK